MNICVWCKSDVTFLVKFSAQLQFGRGKKVLRLSERLVAFANAPTPGKCELVPRRNI